MSRVWSAVPRRDARRLTYRGHELVLDALRDHERPLALHRSHVREEERAKDGRVDQLVDDDLGRHFARGRARDQRVQVPVKPVAGRACAESGARARVGVGFQGPRVAAETLRLNTCAHHG